MDLEQELLEVLDNPSAVWRAVLTHLSPESRTLLHVFATLKTPASLTDWQSAVARVDTQAAVNFEGALRSLDDSFVSISRMKSQDGGFEAAFRNPSMDDFCVESLNSNAGFALTIATSEPTRRQVRRIIALCFALDGGRLKYPALHSALIKDPTILFRRLLELASPTLVGSKIEDTWATTDLVRLAGRANVNDVDLAAGKKLLAPFLLELRFGEHTYAIYSLFDNFITTQGIQKIMGSDIRQILENLWDSASVLPEFDTLVSIDEALGYDGYEADWRDHFEHLNDQWNPDAQVGDLEDSEVLRDQYVRIAEHLDLKEINYSQDWVEHVEALRQGVPQRDDDDDESWLSEENRSTGGASPAGPSDDFDHIDSMFQGLLDRPE